MPRGFFGIGVWHAKTETNIGTLWRSAHAFGADFNQLDAGVQLEAARTVTR